MKFRQCHANDAILEVVYDAQMQKGGFPIYVVLHNIRSAYNVGAILRTCDGAGVAEVILCGYTPAPVDRFGRLRDDIHKAALGAEESVPWRSVEDTATAIAELREKDVAIVAVEQTPDAHIYSTYQLTGPTAFIFGNEIEGIPESITAGADACINLPMRGVKESLNVSVTAGIVLYHFTP